MVASILSLLSEAEGREPAGPQNPGLWLCSSNAGLLIGVLCVCHMRTEEAAVGDWEEQHVVLTAKHHFNSFGSHTGQAITVLVFPRRPRAAWTDLNSQQQHSKVFLSLDLANPPPVMCLSPGSHFWWARAGIPCDVTHFSWCAAVMLDYVCKDFAWKVCLSVSSVCVPVCLGL